MSSRQDDQAERPHGSGSGVGRRDLMKLGVGVLAAAMHGPEAAGAQEDTAERVLPVLTRTGYRNLANRAGGNDRMDDTTRTIVEYATSFSEANLSDPLVQALNRTMVDSMAALVTGFEGEPVRIAARLAAETPIARDAAFKGTVMGYGIPTTPELAGFANSCMVRFTDFNDSGPGGHASDLIPGVLALGEAVHASGTQVLLGITVGYECRATRAIGEQGSAAVAAAKVLGLNEDQMANAVSLAVIPHVPLNKGEGHLSMWKGCRSAEAVKNGVWAALMARAGMTGPPAPFEGVGGRWALFGRREITLPVVADRTCVERQGAKRRPVEASGQAVLELVPEITGWTRIEDIEAIHYRMPHNGWTEIGDAPKFDPQNRETADHGIAFLVARALLDGDIYLDSFTREKYMDPAARALMAKMTIRPVAGWSGLGPARIIIRKNTGEERAWDTLGGVRNPERGVHGTRMTDEEIAAKFNRACEYMQVAEAQRDRARAIWGDLSAVGDIGEAIQALATFGRPEPL